MSERQPDPPSLDDQAEKHRERDAARTAVEAAQSVASEHQRRQMENPSLFEKLREPGVDVSDKYDWVRDELGPELSKANIVGQREDDYERQVKWLDQNEAERIIAEKQPGRILAEHEAMLAVAQGAHRRQDKTLNRPAESDDKRIIRSGMDVATNQKSMRVDGKGVDAVATISTETRTVTEQEEDTGTTRSAAKRLIGRE